MDTLAKVDGSTTTDVTVSVNDTPAVRLDYLDGLRGWASISVLVFHTITELFQQTFPWLAGQRFLLNDGKLAIFVFFVLSGLVLSRQHLLSPNLERIRATAIARYVRLTIPIAAASFAGYILMASGAMFNREASVIVQRPDWLGLMYDFNASFSDLLSFAFFKVYFYYDFGRSYDFVLWTMSFELAGSFLTFAMVALFAIGPRVRIASCVGAIALFWGAPLYLTFVYGYVLANLDLLIRDKQVARGIVGDVAGLLLLAFAAYYRLDHDGPKTNALLGACLVLAPILSPLLRRLLSSSFSKWLGRISFPLYLVHGIIICSISSFLIVRLHEFGWSPQSMAIAVVPATIVISLGVAQLCLGIERFAIRSSHRFASYVLKIDSTVR